jgi:hypothetical protein
MIIMSQDLLCLYQQIQETPALTVDFPEEFGKGRITRLDTNYFSLSSWDMEFTRDNMLHILPLLCNSDFFGVSEIHGQLIRCGTCGNSDVCDYLVVEKDNPLAKEYEVVKDDGGFLVSRKKR